MNERTCRVANASKLDAPERRIWLPPEEVVGLLKVQPGQQVADIGAGTGYFSVPLAGLVGPEGKVWAVDGQQGMLDLLQQKLKEPGAPRNIACQLGSAARTMVPAGSCDVALLANIWHELDRHADVLREVARILRNRGRLAILDWRKDCAPPPGPPAEHRISSGDVSALLASQGWRITQSDLVGQYNYMITAVRVSEGW
jgi:ubiquinone/menaquinone biosynthesis C-methylase UbiE